MLPFTREQFFDVFATYNQAVWPAQLVFLTLALAMLGEIIFQKRAVWANWALAGFWIWTGIVYHALFLALINPLAYGFAAAFVIQGVLLARATHVGTLRFAVPRDMVSLVVGIALMGYALVGYPIVAIASGQVYPGVPTFGVPCPTVIFTFGLLAWSARPSWTLLIVPGAWAVIGISAAIQLAVPEDWGLPVAALAIMLLRRRSGRMRTHDSGGACPMRRVTRRRRTYTGHARPRRSSDDRRGTLDAARLDGGRARCSAELGRIPTADSDSVSPSASATDTSW